MIMSVTHFKESIKTDEYLSSLSKWDACKPPYTGAHMRTCVSAIKVILSYLDKPRRSKYEKENYLRIDFSKAGKVTIYAEFPKVMGLKGRKLGEWPEMTLDVAREKAQLMAKDGLKSDSVHSVIQEYEKSLKGKVDRKKLGEHSFNTYMCRVNNVKLAFGEREVFGDVTYNRLIEVIDEWITTKSNNHALELFAELRRIWKFGSPLFCGGLNVAATIQDDYVSSRVQRPMPTRRYTDIESIANLWINSAKCTSIHQKNALRFMILYGVRPINIHNLEWSYVTDDFSEIIYPAGLIGMRGAMKTQKEFRLPITPAAKRILEEQAEWRDSVNDCNRKYVFLQPRNPKEPFSKRSLDKLIKTYSPENAVKGVVHDGTIKGRSGAFNTMCRKFMKSNVIAQMRKLGYSRPETKEISILCMHHSDREADPMGEHYDFSEEILQEEIALKRTAFEAHERSILTQVALIRRRS
ncbi:recombinase [Budviciaceae bacterium CWB-B4]|uniref:Recombinase n=1 Tax=Limnobaculum xujianqingii TaxID=2738837 RepID=A0A9D7AMC7_9GAMM|nr:tyrosine-type recombinase/integrase [Limnobaculum xujianqingii]MBK5075151.1 recombinase [Limnobaculum xujianqingii]MBK5178467.1 recombinase [Limnobaculum xujianqingii]